MNYIGGYLVILITVTNCIILEKCVLAFLESDTESHRKVIIRVPVQIKHLTRTVVKVIEKPVVKEYKHDGEIIHHHHHLGHVAHDHSHSIHSPMPSHEHEHRMDENLNTKNKIAPISKRSRKPELRRLNYRTNKAIAKPYFNTLDNNFDKGNYHYHLDDQPSYSDDTTQCSLSDPYTEHLRRRYHASNRPENFANFSNDVSKTRTYYRYPSEFSPRYFRYRETIY